MKTNSNVLAFSLPDKSADNNVKKKTKSRANGEGTIYFNEKINLWVAQYCIGKKADGSLNRQSLYAKTQGEVLKKLNKKLVEISEYRLVGKSNVTVVQLASNYVYNQFNSNTITANSYIRRLETIEIIKKLPIGNMQIQKVTIDLINYSLPQIKNYSQSIIGKVIGLLNTTFEYALGLNIIYKNPFNVKGLIIRPKSIKKVKHITALTIDEQQAFLNELDKVDGQYKDILLIALFTGMRIGEILALKCSDIDLENKLIHVEKTLTQDENRKLILGNSTKTYAGHRIIPIFENLLPVFKNILDTRKNGFLFVSKNNNFIQPTHVNFYFKKICKKAHIRLEPSSKDKNIIISNVHTHMLRHTFATRCVESHMNVATLSRILGHKDIQTTLNIYTSISKDFEISEMNIAEQYFKNLGSNV